MKPRFSGWGKTHVDAGGSKEIWGGHKASRTLGGTGKSVENGESKVIDWGSLRRTELPRRRRGEKGLREKRKIQRRQ